jgi:hypothetical protein
MRGDHTGLSETRRGSEFDVRIDSRVYRVTIELERVEP